MPTQGPQAELGGKEAFLGTGRGSLLLPSFTECLSGFKNVPSKHFIWVTKSDWVVPLTGSERKSRCGESKYVVLDHLINTP